jgi:hypothetical protein
LERTKPSQGEEEQIRKEVIVKRFLVILSLILLLAVNTSSQTFQLSGSCQERICEICERKTAEWVASSSNFYSGSMLNAGVGWYCSGSQTRIIEFSASRYVCDDCYARYNEEYRKMLKQADKDWITEIINKNKDRRSVNRDLNKSEALKKLLEEAKGLERKIKELEK